MTRPEDQPIFPIDCKRDCVQVLFNKVNAAASRCINLKRYTSHGHIFCGLLLSDCGSCSGGDHSGKVLLSFFGAGCGQP